MAAAAPSTQGMARRRRRAALAPVRGLLLALTCSAVALHGLGAAATAAATPRASVVSTATTTPTAFVPDWDGHTDATIFEYQLERAGTVHVRVLNEAGYVVATIDSGARASGTHLVSWDGRGQDGTVQPPGTYRIRVDATPAAQQAGTAGIQADVVAPGARAATVTLQQAPVAVTGVALSRPTVGRTGTAATTRALFELSAAAAVSAAIVDGAGRSVATLATGRMTAGDHAVAWNGRTTAGAAARDGEYALVVAASGSGRPTATTRVPLRVDRTLPRMRASKAARATASGSDVSFPVTVVVSEPAAVTVALRSHVVRRSVPAGTTKLVLRGSQLGIARGRVAKTVRVRVAAADAAGNVVTTVSSVVVPAAAHPAGTVPPKQPTTTTPPPDTTTPPPATNGKLAWPIGGPVTSEFGMRGGRPHTGLDIADPTGTPIHPAGPGTVSFVGVYNGYGNIVIVDHPNGMQTYYAHMSRFGGFGVGAKVVHTDTIGYVGCTGHCTGPHVHFETRVGTEHVPKDPRLYLAPR